MKGLWVYVTVMLLIFSAFIYVELTRPPRVDWTVSLSRYDKIPFGTWVVHERMKDIFDTVPNPLRTTLYDHLNNSMAVGEAYILIARQIKTGTADEAAMLSHAAQGNTFFLATEDFSPSLADTLGFSTDIDLSIDISDSTSLRLVNPALNPTRDYPMIRGTADRYFDKLDPSRTFILGTTDKGKPNFVQISVGKGRIILHAAPRAFSNIAVLRGDGHQYVERALSYLPIHPRALYWDDYYSIGLGGPTTPLRVILTRDALRYAYQAAIAAIVLYILFRSKRRQRIITAIEPDRNTTMDFIDTVAQLYFDRADHRDIALKKIGFLLDHIRNRLGISTGILDEDFIQKLTVRSGASLQEVKELVYLIELTRSAPSLVEPELMKLSRTIDSFQKHIIP